MIFYDDEAVIVAGHRIPCENPRLEFARILAATAPKSAVVISGLNSRMKKTAVVGEAGFGFKRDEQGVPVRIPHIGGVSIGENVEIGACSVVARGTVGDTVLGDNVKLDDHVFVAHNVEIGESTLVVAGAVICGSARIGKRCWIGAGALIKEHVTVGDDSLIGMGAVVLQDVPPNSVMVGNPARRLRDNK